MITYLPIVAVILVAAMVAYLSWLARTEAREMVEERKRVAQIRLDNVRSVRVR